MDISISLGGYLDLFDKPKYNKECGWDACELPLGGFFLNGGRFDDIDNVTDEEMEEFFTSLRKRAEECGFYFGQTHSHFDGHIREKYYKGGYEEAVKKEIACVKATHWLGANKMVSHPHMLMTRVYEFNIPESFEQAATFYKDSLPHSSSTTFTAVWKICSVGTVKKSISHLSFSRMSAKLCRCVNTSVRAIKFVLISVIVLLLRTTLQLLYVSQVISFMRFTATITTVLTTFTPWRLCLSPLRTFMAKSLCA